MKQSQNQNQKGFTLIELLIALGVMAVFALMAYRGLDSVLRLHQGAHEHERQAQAIDAVITQFEADVRQASQVVAKASNSNNSNEPRLTIELIRRIQAAGSTGHTSTVVWEWRDSHLSRRVLAGSDRAEQTAVMLKPVTSLVWLQHVPEQEGKPANWQALSLEAALAQPTQSLTVSRGVGVRLTVAGRPIEKVFLMGR